MGGKRNRRDSDASGESDEDTPLDRFIEQETELAERELQKHQNRDAPAGNDDNQAEIEALTDDFIRVLDTMPSANAKVWATGIFMVESLREVGRSHQEPGATVPFRLQRPKHPVKGRKPYARRQTASSIDDMGDLTANDERAAPAALLEDIRKQCTLTLTDGVDAIHHQTALEHVVNRIWTTKYRKDEDTFDPSVSYVRKVVQLLFYSVLGAGGLETANTRIREIQCMTPDKFLRRAQSKNVEDLAHDTAIPKTIREFYSHLDLNMKLEPHESKTIRDFLRIQAAVRLFEAWNKLTDTLEANPPYPDGDGTGESQEELKTWIRGRKTSDDPEWNPDDGSEAVAWKKALQEVLWKILRPDERYDAKKWRRLVRKGQAAWAVWDFWSEKGEKEQFGVLALLPLSAIEGWQDMIPEHVLESVAGSIGLYFTKVKMTSEDSRKVDRMLRRLGSMISTPLLVPGGPMEALRRIEIQSASSMASAVKAAYHAGLAAAVEQREIEAGRKSGEDDPAAGDEPGP